MEDPDDGGESTDTAFSKGSRVNSMPSRGSAVVHTLSSLAQNDTSLAPPVAGASSISDALPPANRAAKRRAAQKKRAENKNAQPLASGSSNAAPPVRIPSSDPYHVPSPPKASRCGDLRRALEAAVARRTDPVPPRSLDVPAQPPNTLATMGGGQRHQAPRTLRNSRKATPGGVRLGGHAAENIPNPARSFAAAAAPIPSVAPDVAPAPDPVAVSSTTVSALPVASSAGKKKKKPKKRATNGRGSGPSRQYHRDDSDHQEIWEYFPHMVDNATGKRIPGYDTPNCGGYSD